MNMISTGAFQIETDASNKQETLAEKFARVWEKKNSKVARAGGVSLMALSLAACGSDDDTTTTDTTTDTTTTDTTTSTTPVNQTLAMSFGSEIVTGGDGDDTINAGLVSDGAGTLVEGIEAEDEIDGGAGSDTLAIVSNSNVGAPVINNVETISVRSTDDNQVLDLALSDSSVATIIVRDSANDVNIDNIQNNVALSFDNVSDNIDIDFDDDALGSDEAVLSVTTDGFVGTLALAVGGDDVITTASLTATGDDSTITSALTTVTDINVSGAGALTLVVSAGGDFDAVDTVSAAGHSGGLTLDLDANDLDVSITTGSGDDSITLSDNGDEGRTVDLGAGDDTLSLDDADGDLVIANASGTVAGDSMDGGAGDDTLSVNGNNGADVFGQDVSDIFTNFENLAITTDDDDTLDLDNITSISNINVTVGLDQDTMSITNVGSQNITFSTGSTAAGAADDGDITLALSDATGDADVGSLTVVGGFDGTSNVIGVITFDDVETLNVTANYAAAITTAANQVLTISQIDADAAETINIDGNATVTIGAITDAVADQVISAAGAAAIDLTFAGAVDVTITGSAGDDTITMVTNMDASDTVDGGDGDDTLEAAVDSTGAGAGNTATVVLAATSNVETIDVAITQDAGAGETAAINAAEVTSGTINLDHSGANAANDDVVSITNLQAGVSITVEDSITNANVGNTISLTAALETATGSADAVTVNFTAADGSNQAVDILTIDDVETLTFSATADASNDTVDDIEITDLNADGATQIVLVSEEDIDLTITDADELETIDASGAVAGVDIDVSGADDTGVNIILGNASAITNTIAIALDNGDALADTITFGSSTVGAVTIADFTAGAGLSGDKLDLSAYGVTGLAGLSVTDDGTDTTIDITDDTSFGSIVLSAVVVGDLINDNFIFA